MKRILLTKANKNPQQTIQSIKCKKFEQINTKSKDLSVETGKVSQETNTKSQIPLALANIFFKKCFQNSQNIQQKKNSYHKLRYKSLDKSSNKKVSTQNFDGMTLIKTDFQKLKQYETLKNAVYQKQSEYSNKNTSRTADTQQKVYKCNKFSMISKTDISEINLSIGVLPQNRYDFFNKNSQEINQKNLFDSEDIQIKSIFQQPGSISKYNKKCHTTRKYSEDVSQNFFNKPTVRYKNDSFNSNLNSWNGQSTLDSYRIRQFLNDQSSQEKDVLENLSSKLCESIRIPDEKNKNQPIPEQFLFQFDGMKDSLIDQMRIKDLNQKPKSQNLIFGKRKSFLRSKKETGIDLKNNPKLYDEQTYGKKLFFRNEQNEQDCIQKDFGSKRTIQQKVNKYKLKSLDQGACTILSRYNKSSDKKSVLNESNIIFQASKMVHPSQSLEIVKKLSNFSDSQVIFKEQNINRKMDKKYNSFIEKSPKQKQNENFFLQLNNQEEIRINSLKNIQQNNKGNVDEIKFDLDNYIDYIEYEVQY